MAQHTLQPAIAFHALQSGHAPPLGDYGAWQAMVDQLRTVYYADGVHAAQTALQAARKRDTTLDKLVAIPPDDGPEPHVPPLPDALAQQIHRTSHPSRWLDVFLATAQQASPVTPESFHEVAGLWILATVAARRVRMRFGSSWLYPNLYAICMSPPGRYAKSVAMDVYHRMLDAAGLTDFLLSNRLTPEALFNQMSVDVPRDWRDRIDSEDDFDIRSFCDRKQFAAQRSWLQDEAAYLFKDLNKDTYAQLLGLILQMYDNPQKLTRETMGGGLVSIERCSLSFLGFSTPQGMMHYLHDERLWDEGLWSRFALITPDAPPAYAVFDHAVSLPSELITDLRAIHNALGEPVLSWVDAEIVGDGKHKKVIEPASVDVYVPPPREMTLSDDAHALWLNYDKAVRYDLLNSGAINDTLLANYTRYPSQALKLAMLIRLADCDDGDVIESSHLCRALQIIERWRANLHDLWQDNQRTSEIRLSDRIVQVLRDKGYALTVRELQQAVGSRAKTAKEVKDVLEVLRLAGQVALEESEAQNKRIVQRWRATT